MSKVVALLVLALCSAGSEAQAASDCFAPDFAEAIAKSSRVVAATPTVISIRRGANQRQTIAWTVNESWKGPDHKGSTFTTRNTWIAPVMLDQPWLLYLAGKEPHQLSYIPCGRSQRLQDALPDVRRLYELSRTGA